MEDKQLQLDNIWWYEKIEETAIYEPHDEASLRDEIMEADRANYYECPVCGHMLFPCSNIEFDEATGAICVGPVAGHIFWSRLKEQHISEEGDRKRIISNLEMWCRENKVYELHPAWEMEPRFDDEPDYEKPGYNYE